MKNRLNQILYALCLSYHSDTEAVLFAHLSSGWATQWVDCLVPWWETALSVFPTDTATYYRIGSQTKALQSLNYLQDALTT